MEGFEEMLKKSRIKAEAKRERVRALINPACGGLIALEPQGTQIERFAIISRNLDAADPGYPWRVTLFDDRGPWGHTVHKTLDGEPGYAYTTSAVQEVAQMLRGEV